MATAGPSAPGTMADDAAVGTRTWSNPGNVASSNDVYATVSGAGFSTSYTHYLKCTNFGFAIPSGATIDGITVSIERKAANSAGTRGMYDDILKIVKGGTVGGTNKADTATLWPTTEGAVSYGGAADLWGNTLSDTDVNASTFGVVLSLKSVASAAATTASVDLITITIDYTEGGGGGGLSIPVAMHSYRQRRV